MTELGGADTRGILTDGPAGRPLDDLGEPLDAKFRQHAMWVDSAGAAGVRLDVSGCDLRPAGDLGRTELTALVAPGSTWCAMELSGIRLGAGRLHDSDFRFANLREADLRGADLRRCRLRNACLAGANLRALTLSGGRSLATQLAGADLSHADLRGADLRGADLSAADLGHAALDGCDLRGADLTAATLPE